MLKEYFEISESTVKSILTMTLIPASTEGNASAGVQEKEIDQNVRLENSEILGNIGMKIGHLIDYQCEEVSHLVDEYRKIFPDVPSKTNAAYHDVFIEDASPI